MLILVAWDHMVYGSNTTETTHFYWGETGMIIFS